MLCRVKAVKNVDAAGGICYIEWKLWKVSMQLVEYVI